MTRDDIIRLTREAGFGAEVWNYEDALTRFVGLVAEHERERIAKMLIDEGWLMAAKLAEVKQ